jgi:hypothetical protein
MKLLRSTQFLQHTGRAWFSYENYKLGMPVSILIFCVCWASMDGGTMGDILEDLQPLLNG